MVEVGGQFDNMTINLTILEDGGQFDNRGNCGPDNSGALSKNFRNHVASDIPVHGQYVDS